ncbi:DUF5958 family protein [Streptomyces sp. NPDC057199]|uniref:DUF5958 family protein n=1 Tax=Streptomyces sp. NPDC057199 TaxID=3346047 RepID=UPI00363FCF9F
MVRTHTARRSRLRYSFFLRHHCIQARAVTEDGPESIRRAGLRPTHTPAVRRHRRHQARSG